MWRKISRRLIALPQKKQNTSLSHPVIATPEPTASHTVVPAGLTYAAQWAWRLIVVAAALAVLIYILVQLSLVVIPVLVALLLTALLYPLARFLRRWMPKALAAFLTLIAGLAVVSGTLTIVVQAFVQGFGDLSVQVARGIHEVKTWLANGPFHMTDGQMNKAFDNLASSISSNQDVLTTGALNTATTALHIVAGFFLVLFSTFFFLKDGRQIWLWLIKLIPRSARNSVDHAGEQAWITLTSYVRGTVFVALVDAIGIGLALLFVGVPLAFPLGALVFLASFVPVLGATVSGVVAVLVTLVTKDPVSALVVLIAVIAVQQLEGHILQPFILGRAVSVHPLAVLLSIAVGGISAGVAGALIAVPLVAVTNTAVKQLAVARQKT